MATDLDLHPNIAPLAPLMGRWAGSGVGKYPTIESFDYLEEVVFTHVGKPFLIYGQKTRSPGDGAPMHQETGYLRVPQPGQVELVLAHPSGISEIEVGTYTVSEGAIELELTSSEIGLTPTAKEVTALVRSVRMDGDRLSYSLEMSAVGQPLQSHLTAVLERRH